MRIFTKLDYFLFFVSITTAKAESPVDQFAASSATKAGVVVASAVVS
jgi:hypothetical protein